MRPIRAQTVVSAADVELAEESVPGALAAIEEAIGLEARVTLYPGPADPRQRSSGRRRWSSATSWCAWSSSAAPLAIGAEGRALDRGGAGERIRVMNLGSRQIVTGAVADDGSIEVGQ